MIRPEKLGDAIAAHLEKLILEPTWVIAANEQSAAVLASRKAGPDVVINEQTKILVRPFC